MGMGVDVEGGEGKMVVEIGGGCREMGVICLGGIV